MKTLCDNCKNRLYIEFVIQNPEHDTERDKIGKKGEHIECIYRPDLRYDYPYQICMDIIKQTVTFCSLFSKKRTGKLINARQKEIIGKNILIKETQRELPEFSKATDNYRPHQRGHRRHNWGKKFNA